MSKIESLILSLYGNAEEHEQTNGSNSIHELITVTPIRKRSRSLSLGSLQPTPTCLRNYDSASVDRAKSILEER